MLLMVAIIAHHGAAHGGHQGAHHCAHHGAHHGAPHSAPHGARHGAHHGAPHGARHSGHHGVIFASCPVEASELKRRAWSRLSILIDAPLLSSLSSFPLSLS